MDQLLNTITGWKASWSQMTASATCPGVGVPPHDSSGCYSCGFAICRSGEALRDLTMAFAAAAAGT
jgi:hypothetical protein